MDQPDTYADLVKRDKTRDLEAEIAEALAEVNSNHRARVTMIEIHNDSSDTEPSVILHLPTDS
ncbi:hypothetical protein [Acinetobacter brisouii]|uniref:hypothetical protein n=1 Tax=Acinetobacter brisouii TaxID=396323 RepID=UPI00124F1866|nr:hypothetical protein [Acinetobacter brisouii]